MISSAKAHTITLPLEDMFQRFVISNLTAGLNGFCLIFVVIVNFMNSLLLNANVLMHVKKMLF